MCFLDKILEQRGKGRLVHFLNIYGSYVFLIFLIYGAFYTVFGSEMLPGKNLYSLFILCLACYFGGRIVDFFKLPPLLGMLIAGILLKNVPALNIGKDINQHWSVIIKSISLVVILIHGGLKCDSALLLKYKCLVATLSCMPCIGEAIIVAIVTHFTLAFPWAWSFMMGFVISPLSPAVIVPSLVKLQDLGYGINKGIPTLILAASSIDGTIAIMGFAIFLEVGLPSSAHKSVVFTALHGPLEILIGLAYGFVLGIVFWYIPSYKLDKQITSRFRFALLAAAGVFAVFGGKLTSFSGAGALGTLCLTLVANYGWFKRGNKYDNVVSRDFKFIWDFFQPLLFGLIGTQMDIHSIKPKFLGYCILIIVIGLICRAALAVLSVMNIGFNWKEKLFVGITWTPKATVQAAIGSIALDTATLRHYPESTINLAQMILTASIIVILITAPLGAIAIDQTGTRLLTLSPSLAKENIEELRFDDPSQQDIEGQSFSNIIKDTCTENILPVTISSTALNGALPGKKPARHRSRDYSRDFSLDALYIPTESQISHNSHNILIDDTPASILENTKL